VLAGNAMIEVYKYAKDLPREWDRVAGRNTSMHKENLALLERVNPCRQEYVVFSADEIYGVLVKYSLRLDIFSFSRLHFYMPVTVIGIPCSVAEQGYSFVGSEKGEIKAYLSGLKGAKLILNAAGDLDFLDFTKGYTLPSCSMNIGWSSFDEYLLALRSHYRYRYKKALKKAEELSIEVLEEEFDYRRYALYEQVYAKSEYKLEKLPIDFFRQTEAVIVDFKKGNEPIAFVQYKIDNDRMVFLFGGLDYSQNAKYDLYQNMLLYLVRAAIENNSTSLELGQTAEEIKCRLGAGLENKYLYIHHSNRVINWLVRRFSSIFSYKAADIRLKLFKD
jgi:hypothetical protein